MSAPPPNPNGRPAAPYGGSGGAYSAPGAHPYGAQYPSGYPAPGQPGAAYPSAPAPSAAPPASGSYGYGAAPPSQPYSGHQPQPHPHPHPSLYAGASSSSSSAAAPAPMNATSTAPIAAPPVASSSSHATAAAAMAAKPNAAAVAASAAAAAADRKEHERDLAEAEQVPALLESLKDYESTIPDDVVTYFLERSGASCSDVKLKRLIAIAAQKFIFEICRDASNYRKLRLNAGGNSAAAKKEGQKAVLTMEDLTAALEEHGIDAVKPAYYADHTSAANTASGAAAADGTAAMD